MGVRVDELRVYPGARGIFSRGSCHLFADSDEELHEFAAKIGMKREWFQPHRVANHYDLTPARRKMAVKLGVTETTARTEILRRREQLGSSRQLVDGRVPPHTVCPFRARCNIAESGQCGHLGIEHPVPYSCAAARALELIEKAEASQ